MYITSSRAALSVLYGANSSPKQKLFLPFVLSWLAARPAAAVATGPHHLAAVAVDVVAAVVVVVCVSHLGGGCPVEHLLAAVHLLLMSHRLPPFLAVSDTARQVYLGEMAAATATTAATNFRRQAEVVAVEPSRRRCGQQRRWRLMEVVIAREKTTPLPLERALESRCRQQLSLLELVDVRVLSGARSKTP